MSIESVKEFYVRLAIDEEFRSRVKGAQGLEQSMKIIQEAGYTFTPAEWEDYTAQILEASTPPMQDLEERELETVIGGAISSSPITFPGVTLPPGMTISPDLLTGIPGLGQPPGGGGGGPHVQPMYGVIASNNP